MSVAAVRGGRPRHRNAAFNLSRKGASRPLPPSTASSSLLPPAPSPPPVPLHPAPPTIRECQVPLLDSSSSHTMLEPHPEDQISTNSYLLRAQQSTGAPNHHSQSTLRPPIPPPHNHHTLSHHQSSANSLNRNTLGGNTLGGRRNHIHAPPTAPGDGPTTPESVQLQDSWVLNSNVPLETRSGLPRSLKYKTEPFSERSRHSCQYRKIDCLSMQLSDRPDYCLPVTRLNFSVRSRRTCQPDVEDGNESSDTGTELDVGALSVWHHTINWRNEKG
ncbi:Teneurin-2 [Triplophysa tibetana]|uniref:Teneurin-2 n=1 Tax=Triplophysa tibetana TaxID=1572043 RepID=A0A5A9NH30_9TELE|nr:Teneurin-2 [Triplophysa tibetana]